MAENQEKINKELQEQIDVLSTQLKEIKEKPETLDIKKFDDVKFYPQIKIGVLTFSGIYNQNSEPTILSNSIAFWVDADGGPAYYIIFNYNGTTKKVALT